MGNLETVKYQFYTVYVFNPNYIQFTLNHLNYYFEFQIKTTTSLVDCFKKNEYKPE